MMRLRRASVIVVLSLLASAATAYAECSWVLWTETEAMADQPSGRWKSASFDRNVYSTRKACEAALIQWIEVQSETARDAGTKVFRRGDGQTISDYKDQYVIIDPLLRRVTEVSRDTRNAVVHDYSCLPDTMDPRGPKGK